ncbi:protein ripply3 isoform X3 [Rissa tridactyla]|uniref:protein ripply3 isoform X3 n=1 Tax=Rissa tridactyla TaxID=75485 RepID=UPI0023BAE3A8|nr:protein ripply3 isoform X3 [Rissa tridactyla]
MSAAERGPQRAHSALPRTACQPESPSCELFGGVKRNLIKDVSLLLPEAVFVLGCSGSHLPSLPGHPATAAAPAPAEGAPREVRQVQGDFFSAAFLSKLQLSPALWRPWVLTARDGEMTENQQMSELDGQLVKFRSKGALGFQHPVRLYLPKSKSQKFLNNIGEKVLASFPVQATIHFYNDDTDSEEDEEESSSA